MFEPIFLNLQAGMALVALRRGGYGRNWTRSCFRCL